MQPNYDYTILLAHGSRDPRWAKPFENLYDHVATLQRNVGLAYMELARPTVDEAVESAIAQGAKHIAVLPLFFAAGKHLREDLPKALDDLRQRLNIATLDLLQPIGEHPAFVKTVGEIVTQTIGMSCDQAGLEQR